VDKFFYSKSRMPNEATQSSRVKNFVVGYRKDRPHPLLLHNDMRAGFSNQPTRFLKGATRLPARNIPRRLGHLYYYLANYILFMFEPISFGSLI